MQAIKDIMTSQFPAIYAHTELTDIIEQLQSHGLFGAPVVDAQIKPNFAITPTRPMWQEGR